MLHDHIRNLKLDAEVKIRNHNCFDYFVSSWTSWGESIQPSTATRRSISFILFALNSTSTNRRNGSTSVSVTSLCERRHQTLKGSRLTPSTTILLCRSLAISTVETSLCLFDYDNVFIKIWKLISSYKTRSNVHKFNRYFKNIFNF